MEPIHVFGLEHTFCPQPLRGAWDIAITDVWIPQAYQNPHFPPHDVPLMVIEEKAISNFTMEAIQALPCIYFTPHQSLDQFQAVRCLQVANTTPLVMWYDMSFDQYSFSYPANLPPMKLWIHHTFANTMFDHKPTLTESFYQLMDIEGQLYYTYDSAKFYTFQDKIYFSSAWKFPNVLKASQPVQAYIKCFETKTPHCAALTLGPNQPPIEPDQLSQHKYQHFAIKHLNFVSLIPGHHCKLSFALETDQGEAIPLCKKAPPIILKLSLQKTMQDVITCYFDGKNGEEVDLGYTLVKNEGRAMYQVGLASLSFTKQFPLHMSLEERIIRAKYHSPQLDMAIDMTITCPEAIRSPQELTRLFQFQSNGVLEASLTPRLRLKTYQANRRVTLRMSKKMTQFLGGHSPLETTEMVINHGGYTFPDLPQLDNPHPIHVKSTLARHGLLKMLPDTEDQDGLVSLNFD